MKKCPNKSVIVISTLIFLFSISAYSQYTENMRFLNGGLSFGYYFKYEHKWDEEGLDFHYLPPFVFQLEKGSVENPNLGKLNQLITWGIFAGFNVKKYDVKTDSANFRVVAFKKYFYCPLGISLTLHCSSLLKELDIILEEKKYDLYISLRGGIVYEHYRTNYKYDPHSISDILSGKYDTSNDKMNIYLAPQIGGRYYFTNDIAAFAELGYYNLSVFTVGATYRFLKKK
jgi:hypothetical protein